MGGRVENATQWANICRCVDASLGLVSVMQLSPYEFQEGRSFLVVGPEVLVNGCACVLGACSFVPGEEDESLVERGVVYPPSGDRPNFES